MSGALNSRHRQYDHLILSTGLFGTLLLQLVAAYTVPQYVLDYGEFVSEEKKARPTTFPVVTLSVGRLRSPGEIEAIV
ncbi:hypothetical protein FOPE_10932 [Fonsecaea pedrosoi]|nr:hypothetical protein FOPE_10932 [Fonsecaea pedrosoi]